MNRIEKYLFTKYKRMVRKQMGGNDSTTSQFPETTVSDVTMPSELLSGGSCAAKKKCAKGSSKKVSSKTKKGGALVEDIKSLAVPFAILLAKEGLEKMFKDGKKKEKKEKTVAKKSTASRRRAVVGGDCTSCAQPVVRGGAKKGKYAKLSEEIDRFLQDY